MSSESVSSDLDQLWDDLASGAVPLEDAVTQLADLDREGEIVALIGERIRIEAAAVRGALAAGSQEPVAMLCRAAGLSVNGYSAILRMRRRRGRTLGGSVSALLSAYLSRPKLSRPQIRDALRQQAQPATDVFSED